MAPHVAFQGEPGAFSEEAVRCVFDAAEVHPSATFEDVFEAVEEDAVGRAVVPIENAVFGSVRVNYDHLRTHAVTIIGELQLRIHHCLMAPEGATIDGLEVVRSHQQALGQCRDWLRAQVPGATPEATPDTAGAARVVAETGAPTTAAVASRRAAERYGLEVLAEGLQDNEQNFTRFLVLAPADTDAPPVGAGEPKTSITFVLQDNVPGALFKSLAVFALRELDLAKIESRPLVGQPGRYRFYLDVHGDLEDEAVARALDHLREITMELQVLGSYPRGATYPEGADR
ncbi:prephenate dehydratase [Salinibacter ruber]|jgi:prephenate dehydratase|uniref:prephenate dehydratase n=1 Tax=Salinibacter ruber TaxID=146919 RepID=UPI000E58D804|nr:prephenate dehydratase [Salinibacter ruber]MBB4069925.1 prephenate dehydratase [Salinibacter ruber]MCS3636638.1 prephenate dehydratase [Salinibacter ruber]MCS3639985.1 prephenate dehydratase [Salinibacter ruber]MCS3644708.1 prephenate dehydratase [Salinibacter ruber]MCS3754137.1 prephenate dehydratase [Salinibacter ruber]